MPSHRTLAATVAALLATVALAGAPPAAHAKRVNPKTAPRAFDSEVSYFYRVVACAGDRPVAEDIAKIVEDHCKQLGERIAAYRKSFVDKATVFFDKVRPAGLPDTVVYPFGGGDLVSALVTFPGAREITTMSLEHAGDPTRLETLTPKQLKKQLKLFREVIRGLLVNHDSESDQLKKLETGGIPGQLAFFVTGMAIMGYQPVSLRYFHLADDGTVVYYTIDEVDQLRERIAKKKSSTWVDTDWSEVFTNSEIELQKVGDPSVTIVHRHLAANLDDKHFPGSPVEKYLDARGSKVSMMTKAASYLLWMSSFSAIRDWVGTHLAWMASDSTGLPPRWAKKLGLEQETYGKYNGSIFKVGASDQAAFAKVWAKQKYRKLGFRYGYRDVDGNPHLVITRPREDPK